MLLIKSVTVERKRSWNMRVCKQSFLRNVTFPSDELTYLGRIVLKGLLNISKKNLLQKLGVKFYIYIAGP